jgi:hypothetical protein
LLRSVDRLSQQVPINPTVGFVPFVRIDDAALSRPVRVSGVVTSRKRARVGRIAAPRKHSLDLIQTDWDVAAQVAAAEAPQSRLPIKSFFAVDHVDLDGRLTPGSRSGLGHHTKRQLPRVPALRVVTPRAASPAAIAGLSGCELLLIRLRTRGTRTVELISDMLARLPRDMPVIVAADTASELSTFSDALPVSLSNPAIALSPAPKTPAMVVLSTGQARLQLEEQFRYALPTSDMSQDEAAIAALGLATWNAQWRSIADASSSSGSRDRLGRAITDLRRVSQSSADRFSLMLDVLSRTTADAVALGHERRRIVEAAVANAATRTGAKVLVVVGHHAETAVLQQVAIARGWSRDVGVVVARDAARLRHPADFVIVCGNYGPETMDIALASSPTSITWVLDPIETFQASGQVHFQASVLHRVGLASMADVLAVMDHALSEAAAGTRAPTVDHHPGLFDWAHGPAIARAGVGMDAVESQEEIDSDADMVVLLESGIQLRVNAARRFDVMRSQSPHPESVKAADLRPGDEILLIRGAHQSTLAELLLEDMDTSELQAEANARTLWGTIVRSLIATNRLKAANIARALKSDGLVVSSQRVAAWMRPGTDQSTPRDWKEFLGFSRAIGMGLPDGDLRASFEAIKRWRIGHRLRGREVVRAVRLAYFGGLSAADLAKIESRWGFGVRDLIEGCSLDEVEAVIRIK